MYNTWVCVLFDTGATHSFISKSCVDSLGLKAERVENSLLIESPMGMNSRVEVAKLARPDGLARSARN